MICLSALSAAHQLSARGQGESIWQWAFLVQVRLWIDVLNVGTNGNQRDNRLSAEGERIFDAKHLQKRRFQRNLHKTYVRIQYSFRFRHKKLCSKPDKGKGGGNCKFLFWQQYWSLPSGWTVNHSAKFTQKSQYSTYTYVIRKEVPYSENAFKLFSCNIYIYVCHYWLYEWQNKRISRSRR